MGRPAGGGGRKVPALFDGTGTVKLALLRSVTAGKGNIVSTYGLKK